MKLVKLLDLAGEMTAYRRIAERLEQADGVNRVLVPDVARPYIIAALHKKLGLPLMLLTDRPETAKKLQEQISSWSDFEVGLFPEPAALPYQRIASDDSVAQQRLKLLSLLANYNTADQPPLLIASVAALMQKTIRLSDFNSSRHIVKQGMNAEPLGLVKRWEDIGYKLENIIEVPGTISRRGGILDIYPLDSELPVRLEFFGNTIESLRFFDSVSQRSLQKTGQIEIGAAAELPALEVIKEKLKRLEYSNCSRETGQRFKQDIEVLLEGGVVENMQFYDSLFNEGSILDYLPQNSLLVLDEPQRIEEEADSLNREAVELLEEKVEPGELPLNLPRPYFNMQELAARMAEYRQMEIGDWQTDEEKIDSLPFVPLTNYVGRLPSFIDRIKQLLKQQQRIIVISHQASRLGELFSTEGIFAPPLEVIEKAPPVASLTLVQGLLAGGWVMNGNTHLFTDEEIFGFVKQQRSHKKQPAHSIKNIVDIKAGDYVVHIEHGIARFAGIIIISRDATEREYLLLHYAAGDRLYVPVDQIDRISRYIGAGDRQPALNRLGTQEWLRVRQKAKRAAEEVAGELLSLYAAREVVKGLAFSPDTVWQQELEASFPYVETPDQITVQEQVKADMMQSKPMDRLVCGDVGYGKTEVALRAAFKAVMDYRQVAVLVPTTILAQQHFFTFSQRLSAFPVRVEMLSRFRSGAEQKAVIESLAQGTVDICIGTHRLLQKDVVFKNLGLLVIDEEQRFGVSHKEHFKQLRREVDVLTLSATPIPRTMHMSLVGVRDMSVMETPPNERLPIKTYVSRYEDRLVREAVTRELERGGQVFFVHNRVRSIEYNAARLRTLLPEASIAVAHGQMKEGELEVVMAQFTGGDIDVLVCSTIIESGLDIPNANTLIVNQADKFGLTQLYQLRGRIGRGANLAYAYFLYDMDKKLTPDAGKRLCTIFEAVELGAGFSIAMKDLEIRGAGNLLGTKQSGHISAVGFNLYTRLLAGAVEEIKAQKAGETIDKSRQLPAPTIALPLPAYIPQGYVEDVSTRLSLYHRLAGVKNEEQIEVLKYDFRDRFGAPPLEVENLLYAIRLKLLAARAGIESISTEEDWIVLRKFPGMYFDQNKLETLLGDGVKFSVTQIRLDYKKLGNKWREVLEQVLGAVG
ncbi:transcription-repair coupling factor [Chloroflexota bacterium]